MILPLKTLNYTTEQFKKNKDFHDVILETLFRNKINARRKINANCKYFALLYLMCLFWRTDLMDMLVHGGGGL